MASSTESKTESQSEPQWQELTAPYRHPHTLRSSWQLLNSVVPFVALWYAMFRSLEVSYWLTLALAPLAAGFLTRIFIIFHDCGHGAFFKSKRANDIVGMITGVLTFTPYYRWRRDHAMHHATSGDLDRRDIGGEIWTLTIEEYLAAPLRTRLAYRFYRHPFVMFVVGPFYLFVVMQRISWSKEPRVARSSVLWTNIAMAAAIVLLSLIIGWRQYLAIQLSITFFAGMFGVWLFYVQHQFETTYWERHPDWDYYPAALYGSSFYKLPRVLQWFSGNIGYHHIHHLNPRIPNYYLQKCHDENPTLAAIPPVTLFRSLRALGYRLWDEERRKMVGFGYLSVYKRTRAA